MLPEPVLERCRTLWKELSTSVLKKDKWRPDEREEGTIGSVEPTSYVRQFMCGNRRNHLEGKERQYALAERAKQLGFAKVVVIDEDLGRSGGGMHERPGFGRLQASVCQGLAGGGVFALGASPLARYNRGIISLICVRWPKRYQLIATDSMTRDCLLVDHHFGVHQSGGVLGESTTSASRMWHGVMGKEAVLPRLAPGSAIGIAALRSLLKEETGGCLRTSWFRSVPGRLSEAAHRARTSFVGP